MLQIIGQWDIKHIMTFPINTLTSVVNVLTYIITSITAVLIRLAAIIAIMYFSTFISTVLNAVVGDKYSDKTCLSIMK
jgi:hypothetical protein